MQQQPRVLVFSLDLRSSKLITNRLSWFGFKVYSFKTFKKFWSCLSDFHPDLIVVDDSFVSKYIFSFIKNLNQISNVPILFLTDDSSSLYQLYFFDIAHVIIRPFSIDILDLKVSSILNKNNAYLYSSSFKSNACLSIFLNKKLLQVNQSLIPLTKTEFDILSLILGQKDQSYCKSMFLKHIWNYDDFWSLKSNLLETHFSKLKKKLTTFFRNSRFLIKRKNNFLFYF
jgi:DNA-binding response OmpR family regulator